MGSGVRRVTAWATSSPASDPAAEEVVVSPPVGETGGGGWSAANEITEEKSIGGVAPDAEFGEENENAANEALRRFDGSWKKSCLCGGGGVIVVVVPLLDRVSPAVDGGGAAPGIEIPPGFGWDLDLL